MNGNGGDTDDKDQTINTIINSEQGIYKINDIDGG